MFSHVRGWTIHEFTSRSTSYAVTRLDGACPGNEESPDVNYSHRCPKPRVPCGAALSSTRPSSLCR